MKCFVKTAIGIGALIFVGMVGLSAMSMVWAIAAPHHAHNQVAHPAEVPARAVATLPGQPAAVNDVWPVNPPPQWSAPAQIQVAPGRSWLDTASSFVGIIMLFGMPTIIFFVIRTMRRGRASAPSDESALVHELVERARDLSDRMEALETILLDRTRATR